MKRRRSLTAIAIALATALATRGAPALTATGAPVLAEPSDLLGVGGPDFVILSPDGTSRIGRTHYSIIERAGALILRGEDRFDSGEYDIETSRLTPAGGGGMPALVDFNHMFYSAEGTVVMEAHADLRTGLASCIDRRSGTPELTAARIEFPPDTWAGASVILPIQRFLRAGGHGKLSLHVFNCAPSPKVFAVEVTPDPAPTRLPDYLPGAIEIDAKPDFGWLDFIVAPFVPKLRAWFDPGRDFEFVGAMLERYYGGPRILMVTARAFAQPPRRQPTAPR
jgi:hypothetical protein